MSHLDDLKRQYSHTAVEITRLAHEYAAVDPNSSQAQAILRQFRPVADKFDVLIEAVDTEQKRLAANAQQPRRDFTSSYVPDREDYDDYLYRGAVQQEDARRREQSHQQFHRDFPGLDCNRERR